jgi:hypothetical protein
MSVLLLFCVLHLIPLCVIARTRKSIFPYEGLHPSRSLSCYFPTSPFMPSRLSLSPFLTSLLYPTPLCTHSFGGSCVSCTAVMRPLSIRRLLRRMLQLITVTMTTTIRVVIHIARVQNGGQCEENMLSGNRGFGNVQLCLNSEEAGSGACWPASSTSM